MLSPELQAAVFLREAAQLANGGKPDEAIARAQTAIRILTPVAIAAESDAPATINDA